MAENIKYIFNSNQGVNRKSNQDDILILGNDSYYLFFLFDGVSSIDDSIQYIKHFKKEIENCYSKYFTHDVFLDVMLYEIHQSLLQKNNHSGKSTCSALYLSKTKSEGVYLNIGDSRIYEFSNQFLNQITIDDSLPGNTNILTKCLGSGSLKRDDFVQKKIKLEKGILLCSDGFYSLMHNSLKRYFDILNFKYFSNIVKAIGKEQKGNNSDDSTYIIIRKNGF